MPAPPQAEMMSRRVSWSLAALLIALSTCVICGWVFRIPVLKGSAFGTFVAPESALLFGVSAISAFLQSFRRTVWLGKLLGIGVALFSAAVLLEYMKVGDLGVDRWFLPSRLSEWRLDSPVGRMAFPTTVSLLCSGIALIWLRTNTRDLVDACAAVQLILAYLAIIGHLYGVPPMYGYVMGVPTPFLVIVLSFMLLSSAQASTMWRILCSADPGGVTVRRLVPLAVILLPTLGFVRLKLQTRGLLQLQSATALLVLSFVVIFSIVAFRTASEVNRVDAERKAAQQALIRSEKLSAAGRLAATLAHEINNPLGGALNSLYLARTAPQDAQHWIEVAEENIMRVSALARRSLSFYRTGSTAKAVAVESAIQDVVELFRPLALTRKISLTSSAEAGLNCSADPGELRQILMNLVVNAIDATPEQGLVHVESRALDEARFEIVVLDTGPGIPDDLRDRIFEPFFTTKPDTGTGLGLHVVKELVAKFGGELRVDSSRTGTCFTLVFARTAAPKPTAQANSSETRAAAS